MRPADPASNDSLLALALELAQAAGELLQEGQAGVASTVTTKSTLTDVVTAMDVASERLIVDGVLAVRRDDGFLGEEGSDTNGTSGVRWIIDPLDGTVNYLYGLPAWAVSIAVEVDGSVVAGVVHAPVLAKTYVAVAGGVPTRNGAPIQCSAEKDPSLALVATGFAYDAATRLEHGAVVARVIGQIRDIRRAGSAALDLCSVADGTMDAYFERGPHEWDLAAGGLIASRAGAGVHRSGDFVATANPALLEQLLAMGLDSQS